MADEWLVLRPLWTEVAAADQGPAIAYFRFSSSFLMTGTRDQIIAAYESGNEPAPVPTSLLAHAASQGDTDITTTAPINTTGSTLIVAFGAYQTASGADLSDNAGNAWTALTEIPISGNTPCRLFYANNPIVSPTHTFTLGGASQFPGLVVAAFAGNITIFDVENGSNSAGNAFTIQQTGSITPSVNNELVIFGLKYEDQLASVDVGAIIDQLGFLPGVAYGVALAYEIQTTAMTRNPTWSWTNPDVSSAVIASFGSS
jgi:hypothetical protein